MKLEFSRQIFGKSSTAKFNQNPSSGNRDVPCGEMDGHDEANGRFSQFWNAPKIEIFIKTGYCCRLHEFFSTHLSNNGTETGVSLSSSAATDKTELAKLSNLEINKNSNEIITH